MFDGRPPLGRRSSSPHHPSAAPYLLPPATGVLRPLILRLTKVTDRLRRSPILCSVEAASHRSPLADSPLDRGWRPPPLARPQSARNTRPSLPSSTSLLPGPRSPSPISARATSSIRTYKVVSPK